IATRAAGPPRGGIRHRRRGAAMLEFAIVAQVLFFTILACIEFTRVVMVQAIAEDAAYEAARHVVVPGATIAEAQSKATSLLNTLRVTASSIQVQAYEGTSSQTAINEDTTEVRVTVTIPVSNISLFTPRWVMGNRTIVKRSRLFTERYDGYYDGVSGS
ncbi:MAG TPA: TadE/TadG family type IV pilus assembly protein, partial [Pirellulaceae bacterium]